MRDDVREALLDAAWGPEAGRLQATFRFDPALAVFGGHFPGRPLVPGVFQIEMVRTAVERVTGSAHEILGITRAKFSGAVAPGTQVALEAQLIETSDRLEVRARLTAGGVPAGRLTLLLRGPTPPDGQPDV